jgi:hypothetical protein
MNMITGPTPAEAVHRAAVRGRIRVDIARIARAASVLARSLDDDDLTAARYAAATITERSDQVESALLDLEADAKAVRVR